MKKSILVYCSLLPALFFLNSFYSQVPNNSKKFLISEYYYPDNYGNFNEYLAHGYATPKTSTTAGKLFILPILEFLPEKVQYFDFNGNEIDEFDAKYEDKIKSISIPVKISSRLPQKEHLPAIGATLENSISIDNYLMPLIQNINGGYVTYTPNMGFEPTWRAGIQKYVEKIQKQLEYIDAYSNYQSEVIDLAGLKVEILVDNEVVGLSEYPDSFVFRNGKKLTISVINPTTYQKNRILGGSAKILASYKFRNANVSVIKAKFDAKQIINTYLNESQKSHVKGKSSGFQFLGFGSRKKKLKTYFNQSINSQAINNTLSETTIEMSDATEQMINRFNEAFFPKITRQKLINNHLMAAQNLQEGDKMKEIHLKYASALQMEDPNLEVDVEGALASLAAQDYVGFIAKGIAVGSVKISGNSEYVRTISNAAEISKNTVWNDVQSVSVQHALQEEVSNSEKKELPPFLGIISFIPQNYSYPLLDAYNNPIRDVYGNIKTKNGVGVYIYGIIENGPAHNAGLQSGMFLTTLDNSEIRTRDQLTSLIDNKKADEKIDATIMIQNFNGPPTFKKYTITLSKGFPLKKGS